MTNNNNNYDRSRASWLARGLEQLLDTDGGDSPTFDVVIIGSGYGGAIAANTFAGRQQNGLPISVCVLERGNEYLPGMFPHGLAELPTHVRVDQNKEGLFDARAGEDVSTLVANGVGGGSLINAGVMEVPRQEVFENRWPSDLSNFPTWKTYFDQAREVLGAGTETNLNTIDDHPDPLPQKTAALREIGESTNSFRFAAITVAMQDSQSSGSVNLNQCLRCGDCATGCNFGAKISLDVSLLANAHRNGAKIYSGATVLSVEKDGGDWLINTVYTNATLRKRLQGNSGPAQIRAKKVILAAGTLGSTEILSRSQAGLNLSAELGKHCSTNGDMLVADYATRDIINNVANENIQPTDRTVGPTITGVIDLREDLGVLIEEMSVPAGIRRIFTEIFTTTNTLHRLNEADHSSHENGFPNGAIYAARHNRIDKTALYAVMGDDGAAGHIEVAGNPGDDEDGIGKIVWTDVQKLDLFDEQVEAVTNLTAGTHGDVIPNPVWNLLPPEMSFLLDNQHGPVITVHPLGGCAMADSVADGVVDDLGQVFDASAAGAYHDGLVVLDGAIIPTALATNPALTISAVALRASQTLANRWGYLETATMLPSPIDRPIARDTNYAFEPEGTTEIQLCERMHGEVSFRDADDRVHDCVVEITMRSEETPVSKLTYPDEAHPAEIILDTTQDGAVTASRVRIYKIADWDEHQLVHVPDRMVEDVLDKLAIFRAPLVSGTLSVFQRRKSNQFSRFFQAGPAYLKNRGLRDVWQAMTDPSRGSGGLSRAWQRVMGFFRLSTRAGEKRWLRYELRIGSPDNASTLELRNDLIVGRKRFTYRRRANPWRQLMRMRLRRFPGLRDGGPRKLDLDLQYLVRIGIPLLRITRQSDGVTALAELASFLGYLTRLMLGIHIWSFRRPDRDPDPAPVNPLPGSVADISAVPQEFFLPMGEEVPDGADDGVAVKGNVRLLRYENPGATRPPIVMLHGYSASGTTFAHHAIPDGLASQFFNSGRDVWIADLRSSACMTFIDGLPIDADILPTASEPWSMEQIAYRDIPEVFNHISNTYGEGGPKIDVLAHCMGAVMFSMAVLRDDEEVTGRLPRYKPGQEQLLRNLPDLIRRVAFSQVGPLVVFSPANRFRAYATRYLRGLLPGDYQFNPGESSELTDQLVDRILSTLPYPEREYDRENPTAFWKRTPWTRTRHRMDALYGRDFNVLNVSDDMLRHIDDHFGALSIETVTQTMHFARYNTITDRTGYNSFVSRETLTNMLRKRWEFPVLSVHGRDNGLADVTTVDRMKRILEEDAGRNYRSHIIPDAGHQDALIGEGRFEMANTMIAFFDDTTSNLDPDDANDNLIALTPWIGPIFSAEYNPDVPIIRIGAHPSMREPATVVMLRVQIVDGELRRHNDGMPFDTGDEAFVATNMITYWSTRMVNFRWDSFPMPMPPAVPASGDGMLVLILYAESGVLPSTPNETFYSLVADLTEVVEINQSTWDRIPHDPALPSPPPPPVVTVDEMLSIARATLSRLLGQNAATGNVVQPAPDPNNPILPAIFDPAGSGPIEDPIE